MAVQLLPAALRHLVVEPSTNADAIRPQRKILVARLANGTDDECACVRGVQRVEFILDPSIRYGTSEDFNERGAGALGHVVVNELRRCSGDYGSDRAEHGVSARRHRDCFSGDRHKKEAHGPHLAVYFVRQLRIQRTKCMSIVSCWFVHRTPLPVRVHSTRVVV